jgi:hypothetical protein
MKETIFSKFQMNVSQTDSDDQELVNCVFKIVVGDVGAKRINSLCVLGAIFFCVYYHSLLTNQYGEFLEPLMCFLWSAVFLGFLVLIVTRLRFFRMTSASSNPESYKKTQFWVFILLGATLALTLIYDLIAYFFNGTHVTLKIVSAFILALADVCAIFYIWNFSVSHTAKQLKSCYEAAKPQA